MALPTKDAFTFDWTAQADYPSWTPTETKTNFGAQSEELRLALNAVVNLLNAATDGASGADNVAMTAIATIGVQATVQSIVEALVTRLQATTDSASGADFTGATAISGLTGATVQALLEALDGALTTHKTSTDHNGTYYTETELNAGQLNSLYFTETEVGAATGAALVGATAPSGLVGTTVQALIDALKTMIDGVVLGSVADGSLTDAKLSNTAGQIKDSVTTHIANTATAHGAVSAATASKIIVRDASGRAKVAAPSAEDDIALKSNVTTVATALSNHQADYAHHYKKDAGSTDAYVVALDPAITSYTEGMTLDIFCKTANTGAATLDAGGGAKDLRKYYNDALETGDIEAGAIITVKWDSANDWWQVTSGIKVTVSDASDTVKGIVELATAAEVTEGTSTTTAVTPAGAKVELDKKASVASGMWADTTTSLAANATYTKSIPIGFSGQTGHLILTGSNDSSRGAIVHFTTNINDAVSLATLAAGDMYGFYGSTTLSGPVLDNSSNYIKIQSVQINGTNLEIVFKNTDTGSARTLRVYQCVWEVLG